MYIFCNLLIVALQIKLSISRLHNVGCVTVRRSVLYFNLFCFVVPGEPYPVENDSPPAPVPAPSGDNFEGMDWEY